MTHDFTAGGIHALPTRPRSIGDREIDERIRDLVKSSGCKSSDNLIQEMIVTALKIGREGVGVADLKMFNRSLREMGDASKLFEPYQEVKKVTVFGSARTAPEDPSALAAEEFARKMCENGYMVITGGGGGIMGAAQRGAGREHSFGLNIRLPFEQGANPTIRGDNKLITFNYFFTRKLNFVKETHSVALFPGGFGTMDEGFETLTLMQTGKARILPMVFIEAPGGTHWKTWWHFLSEHLLRCGLISEDDFKLFKITQNVDEAVAEILQFYKNFRSYRWVKERMVIRLKHSLTASAVKNLNREFADVLKTGGIQRAAALPEERNEPDLKHAPRLVLTPHRRNYGRLRELINAINLAKTKAQENVS